MMYYFIGVSRTENGDLVAEYGPPERDWTYKSTPSDDLLRTSKAGLQLLETRIENGKKYGAGPRSMATDRKAYTMLKKALERVKDGHNFIEDFPLTQPPEEDVKTKRFVALLKDKKVAKGLLGRMGAAFSIATFKGIDTGSSSPEQEALISEAFEELMVCELFPKHIPPVRSLPTIKVL